MAEKKAFVEGSAENPVLPLGRYDVLGVSLTHIGLEGAVQRIIASARGRRRSEGSSLAVHGLVLAARDWKFRAKVEKFDILVPDGQPVRWLMNRTFSLRQERVCGTDLMDRVCAACASQSVGVYLYGSTERVNLALRQALSSRYPSLIILGYEPSMFRPLSAEEDDALVDRVNSSGAGVLFVGLGCPLQEEFVHFHRSRVLPVQLCVGAAFDFVAGEKRRAPLWMQKTSLEWLHRLVQEPRRLAKRYGTTNAWFIWLTVRYWLRRSP